MNLSKTPIKKEKNIFNRLFKGKSIFGNSLKKHSVAAFWLDIVLNLIIIIGLVVLIRTYIISPFQVFGPSMCDTLNSIEGVCQRGYGEYLIVNKFGYQNILGWQVGLPERGDIVVFHPPQNDSEFYIKRVIGLPGETVELKDGYVYVFNDENPKGYRLEEEYLSSGNLGNTHPMDGTKVFEVPKYNYLVFGDNRLKSSDARSCFSENFSNQKCGDNGTSHFLPLDHIEGKAMIILWPLNKISIISDPVY